MVTFEEFEDMMYEIVQTMPEVFFRELNGGVFAREAVTVHPESRGEELLIMGQYCVQPHLGRFIVLYYGSFMRIYGNLSGEALRRELRRVILHEFRHHLESLAGERDLEIEDAIAIAQYKHQNEIKKKRGKDNDTESSCNDYDGERGCDEGRALSGQGSEYGQQFHQSGEEGLL